MTRSRIGAAGIVVVLALLSGCAASESQALSAAGKRINTPAFIDAVRGAASPDGVVARADDNELLAAAVRICVPTEGAGDVGVTIGDVVVPDRADVDALVNAAREYVCS